MEFILSAILIIAIIPAALFLYANLSTLVQLIFNKNFDEPKFKKKWQLNSYASYTLVGIGIVNFLNVIFIKSIGLDSCISVALVVGSYWYLLMLIKNYFSKETA